MKKRYFEFVEQEYYGLITVNVDEGKPIFSDVIDAANVYVKTIGGETIEEVLEAGHPKLISKQYAFWKLANVNGNENMAVIELLEQFKGIENGCVVVDGALA